MIVKDFFENSIERNIETVIKADDRDNIANEVEEYVVTNEISKKNSRFFHGLQWKWLCEWRLDFGLFWEW